MKDLEYKQKYLVAFTVGAKQKKSIDTSVKKVLHISNKLTFMESKYNILR